MTGRKRFGALLLCIGLLLVLSVSTAFIAHEADHDCCGEDCPICRTIAVNISLLRTLGLAVLMMFYTAAKIRRSENKTVAAVCKTGLFSFLVMLQSDFIPYFSWYMVAFLANCAILLAEDSGGSSFPGLLADRFREREFKTER